jgi:hypothetical protein
MDAAVCSPTEPALWWQAILHRRTSPIERGRVRRAEEPHVYTSLRTCPFRFAICLCGAPHVPDAVLLALRPYWTYRVALSRGTLAPPGGCAAVHRSGNNSSVLAVPRSMCVMTLSKCIPTSRSILSELATSDIKLAFHTLARRDPMNNQFLRPTA